MTVNNQFVLGAFPTTGVEFSGTRVTEPINFVATLSNGDMFKISGTIKQFLQGCDFVDNNTITMVATLANCHACPFQKNDGAVTDPEHETVGNWDHPCPRRYAARSDVKTKSAKAHRGAGCGENNPTLRWRGSLSLDIPFYRTSDNPRSRCRHSARDR